MISCRGGEGWQHADKEDDYSVAMSFPVSVPCPQTITQQLGSESNFRAIDPTRRPSLAVPAAALL